ncbi:AraC family transcriptional regulator [Elizabethkingia sp. JS20170427COW]|uniref:helix-turn-helix domain-containing protein n=1 Tax=Elizabethkingia sp. JS20170427COW TaxID=2583851 RepID=UPI0011108A14|nr:AraC family transcriptional regulator [Elizabethkingia sp. JS20170427COW]QCX54201.1 helix-turn-helix transcriptional regulator [Elizabethkingia sp. JS20170427COW]
MKLYIKNMVCPRCITAVKNELENLGLEVSNVKIGQATLKVKNISSEKMKEITTGLESLGFELLENKKNLKVEKIKNIIIDLVHKGDSVFQDRLSVLISSRLNQNYSALSNLFSKQEGITIEKFFIRQKIEKVKELLLYNELNINEIAYKLDYSSVAHLSNQFKKITGYSPTAYRKIYA